jgi:hypothetical protein
MIPMLCRIKNLTSKLRFTQSSWIPTKPYWNSILTTQAQDLTLHSIILNSNQTLLKLNSNNPSTRSQRHTCEQELAIHPRAYHHGVPLHHYPKHWCLPCYPLLAPTFPNNGPHSPMSLQLTIDLSLLTKVQKTNLSHAPLVGWKISLPFHHLQ